MSEYRKVYVVWGTDMRGNFSEGKVFEDPEDAKAHEKVLKSVNHYFLDDAEMQELEYVPKRKDDKKEWQTLMTELEEITDLYVKKVNECREKLNEMYKDKTLKHSNLKDYWRITSKARSSNGNMRDPKYQLLPMPGDDEEIEKAIKNSRTSLKIDGYLVRKNHEELVRKKLKGEITQEEFLRMAERIVLEESGLTIIDDPNDIPKNMTEKEEHEFWRKHTMSERLLEESIIEEDDDLPPPRRKTNENKRSGRNIELTITDDISHTGLTEEEYKIIEEDVEKSELPTIKSNVEKNRKERELKRKESKKRTEEFIESLIEKENENE